MTILLLFLEVEHRVGKSVEEERDERKKKSTILYWNLKTNIILRSTIWLNRC